MKMLNKQRWAGTDKTDWKRYFFIGMFIALNISDDLFKFDIFCLVRRKQNQKYQNPERVQLIKCFAEITLNIILHKYILLFENEKYTF